MSRQLPRFLLAPCAAVLLPALAHADPPSLLDRGVVAAVSRRAIARAGLAHDSTRELATRARAAGWLPRVTVRVVRGLDASTTFTGQPADHATSADSLVLDLRANFTLDRLLFDRSEVSLSRVELARAERRALLEREVIELLGAMERARIALRDQEPLSPEAARTRLEYDLARARIEALMGARMESVRPER